jgi:hypothetical protein
MPQASRKCWLTFEGGCQDEPCIWELSQKFPEVRFDIRQAHVGAKIGVMALQFDGDPQEIEQAVQFLESKGVHVDPVEGGSLVAG